MTEVIYNTLDFDQCWSSAAKSHLGCSPALELGCKRTPQHGKNFEPEVWRKNNRALIKTENLKGDLGHPRCELFEYTSAILKIGDGKIC
jgi:hypothetical protein